MSLFTLTTFANDVTAALGFKHTGYILREFDIDGNLLFEHIEKEMFINETNFHLVEEFNNGNALILPENIEENGAKLLSPN